MRTNEVQNQDADCFDDLPVRGTKPISEVYERCNAVMLEPASYEEATKENCWIEALEVEIAMIKKNETGELVDRPVRKNIIGVKSVYKTKLNVDGSVNRLKAKLVAKGFSQLYGVDYAKTFVPVARLDTIRLLLIMATQKGWKIHQLDVKRAFLNGILKEEFFVEQL